MKLIAVNGRTANGEAAKDTGDDVKHFPTEPYTAGTLLNLLRAILDQA